MLRLTTLIAGLVLAACALPKTEQRTGTPQVGEPPTRVLTQVIQSADAPLLRRLGSFKVKNLLDGSVQVLNIRRYGNGIKAREADGCVWTKAIDWFAPSDSFAYCSSSKNWQAATAQVQHIQSIFPMKVGARGEYYRRAVSATKKVSERRTRCKVRDAVEVLLPSEQAVAAYVVRCDDGRIRRTTWFAPGIGPVAYREVHKKRGVRDAWVRMSIGSRV